jgi:hypothetical protein
VVVEAKFHQGVLPELFEDIKENGIETKQVFGMNKLEEISP